MKPICGETCTCLDLCEPDPADDRPPITDADLAIDLDIDITDLPPFDPDHDLHPEEAA